MTTIKDAKGNIYEAQDVEPGTTYEFEGESYDVGEGVLVLENGHLLHRNAFGQGFEEVAE